MLEHRVASTAGGVARLRDTAKLAELYAAHGPSAARLAYLLTGERELAEDLAHEAFIRLAGRFHHVRSQDAFPAYLRAAVVNVVRNHLRRRRLERAVLDRIGSTRPTDRSSAPDVEQRDELWRCLQALPYRQRAAIVLRYYEDLSEQQTADVLGCSVNAVKGLVARGLERLRRSLEGRER